MSSKRRPKNTNINKQVFEKLLTGTEDSETEADTSAFNSSPRSEISVDMEEEEEEDADMTPSNEYNLAESLHYKLASKDKAVISLLNDTKFFFKGQVQIKVLKGKLEILGHVFTKDDGKFVPVYSPRGYSLLYCHGFHCDDSTTSTKVLVSDLLREGLSLDDSESFTGDCIFVVRRLQEPWSKFVTDKLRQCSKMNLLYRDSKNLPEQAQNDDTILALELALDINLIHPAVDYSRMFKVGESWGLALQSVQWCRDNNILPHVLVAGGKGVGKSTFVRWLTNKLLASSPVVLLDLDPGQTEVTTPGYLSVSLLTQPLLGPNFTHVGLTRPRLSVYLGDVSVQNCPDRHLKIIADLWQYVRDNLTGYPVVVNTMGWSNGMGLMMLVDTIRMLQPSSVVQLHSRYQRKNFPFSLTSSAVGDCKEGWRSRTTRTLSYNLLEFPAVPESETARDMRSGDYWGLPEPRLLRELVLLGWLGRTDWQGWTVHSISLSSLALGVTHSKVKPGALLAACNLSLVDLCRLEERDMSRPVARPELYSVARRGVRPASLGLGLVRNIDTLRHLLYLATPLSAEQLAQVNCLMAGEVKLPASVLSSTNNSPYFAPQSDNPLDCGWQRYHKPRANL